MIWGYINNITLNEFVSLEDRVHQIASKSDHFEKSAIMTAWIVYKNESVYHKITRDTHTHLFIFTYQKSSRSDFFKEARHLDIACVLHMTSLWSFVHLRISSWVII